jgi:hypothetical protein
VARYRIVPEQSLVVIDAKSSLHPIHTRTRGLEGALDLDVLGGGRVNLRAEPRARLSLAVEKLSSGNPLEDRELRRRIEAGRYRSIDGELSDLLETGEETRYVARGDVTFRGVTKTYEDEVVITQVDERTLRLEGTHTFDIRDFGMKPPRILMLRVQPDVDVRIEIIARRES